MKTFGINDGHTKSGIGSGAVGIISESEHTRLVGQEVRRLIVERGHKVVNCTIDYSSSVSENLSLIVQQANITDLDWFVSIHFNAGGGRGTEVYTYEGRQYEDALEVCDNISKLGFKNRGVKAGTGLYVIRRTKAKSMLIEVCFVDTEDANQYLKVGYKVIAKAIVDALIGYVNSTIPSESIKETWDNSVKDKEGTITASSLNIRYTPGGKVIGSLSKGSKVKLWRLEGDWYHIYSPVDGYNQAYVHKNYVQIINTENTTNKMSGKCTPTSELNVRSGPGSNHSKIGMVYPGGELQLHEQSGDWYKISYVTYSGSTKTGWVSSSYVRKL